MTDEHKTRTTQREGNCAVCGGLYEADGKTAGVAGGRFLCSECAEKPVEFVAQCLDCDWDYRCEDTEYNRYHSRVRVQQEGNSHEDRKSFDDENHETVWREAIE